VDMRRKISRCARNDNPRMIGSYRILSSRTLRCRLRVNSVRDISRIHYSNIPVFHHSNLLVRSIDVVRLSQLGGADDLRGDVMAAVHHVQMHIAIEAFERVPFE